ncbi:hypothetical protein FKB34_08980 [Glycocaulis profundi]|nr:hypothetical protein FKB34_08980 [Glycocaulis profundi]
MSRRLAALAAVCLSGTAAPAMAQDETGAALPEWLSVSGSARARYETLNNRFRLGETGSDQVMATRLRLKLEADAGPLDLVLELSDSRGFLNSDDSNVSTSLVNPAEVLQAYAQADLGALTGDAVSGTVRAGRFTMDIGSRRVIGTSSDSNHPNVYTGAQAILDMPGGWTLTGFYTAPVERLPTDGFRLLDNEAELDETDWDDRIWGVHARSAAFAGGVRAEAYLIGVDQQDGLDILVPGARVRRAPEAGAFDFDLELTAQTGEMAVSGPAPGVIDHEAWGLVAVAGYSLDARFGPRVSAQYLRYSGGQDAGAGETNRYAPLFSSRGGDIGMTGIFGPMDRENISAPGLRLELEEGPWESQILYHAVWLADDTDRWRPAGLRDPSGQTGGFVGHVIDAQYSRALIADRLDGRVGAVALLKGEFARNAPGAPDLGDSVLVYAELTASF